MLMRLLDVKLVRLVKNSKRSGQVMVSKKSRTEVRVRKHNRMRQSSWYSTASSFGFVFRVITICMLRLWYYS